MKKGIIFYALLLIYFPLRITFAQNPEWIIYTSQRNVACIAIETNTVWAGTNDGLVQLNMNSENIIYYNKANYSGLYVGVESIAIDKNGNKWLGTTKGLIRFDGTNWSVYNESNSVIPDNRILSIATDESGNKWIGTNNGLAVFNQRGVVTNVERPNTRSQSPDDFRLFHNYPNPFNPSTTITFNLPNTAHVKLTIYEILGREVKRLVDEQKSAGQYKTIWDGTNEIGKHVAAGLYFYKMQTEEFIQTNKMLLVK